ncbi:plant UBX domain-containing protein 7-like [Papaver somniferum]|uniref:plant UBX domain-containing protein 7-like n=1 Tax=Papaver somniferum TaxID=3469 RepID=UPI000E6FA77E|nr:plant UBX domain-containing protein 7-like [Papaver somniferum]
MDDTNIDLLKQEIEEIESDFDEQEWGTDDDVQQEIESCAVLENNLVVQKDTLISSFLEVGVGQSIQIAKQYLEATNWDLEGALTLLYSAEARYPNTSYELINLGEANARAETVLSDVSAVDNSLDDNLASMYPPPMELMYDGPFHKAKKAAEDEDRWLIVNVQSKQEFSSLTLNLDTWAHEAVSQIIAANFIFWQVYNDVTEGQKISNYYKLTAFPAVLVLDPITGKNVKSWTGTIDAVQLLEDLAPYMDAGPKHHLSRLFPKRPTETSQQTTVPDTTEEEDEEIFQAILASMQNMTATVAPACSDTDEPVTSSNKKLTYPDLPEEPKVEKTLLCRIGVRLPDGRRLQRNFLRTDPVQLLWSFCNSQLDEAESRPFHLTQAIPGSSKTLDYESKETFDESGLSNSMISVTWD